MAGLETTDEDRHPGNGARHAANYGIAQVLGQGMRRETVGSRCRCEAARIAVPLWSGGVMHAFASAGEQSAIAVLNFRQIKAVSIGVVRDTCGAGLKVYWPFMNRQEGRRLLDQSPDRACIRACSTHGNELYLES